MSVAVKLFKPLFRRGLFSQSFSSLKFNNNNQKSLSLFECQSRSFSGPQEPEDQRSPYEVEPDYWDARHWAKIVSDIESEIQHYDPKYAIIDLSELEYDLKFAKKMLEWRKLEKAKYLTPNEQWEQGIIESMFGTIGYKMRAENDYRVVGGRGGVDTKQNFYDTNYIYGPFGTEENPVLVPSRGRFRYVACIGGYDGEPEHELAWFCLRQGPKHRCPVCGQIFQLWTTDSSHKDHPYHDPKRDYEKELINILHS